MPVGQKKVPVRTCIGCRSARPKNELIRVVRNPDGTVCLDKKGKISGRGAYICPNPECLRKAQKSKSLSRALEVQISDSIYDSIAEMIENDE